MVSPGEEAEANAKRQILPGYDTIDDFTKAGFQAVMEATKFSNKLPTGHAWDLYSAYPSFQAIMNTQGRRILEIMNMVLGHQGIRGNIAMRDTEEKYDLLVDCNDTVLERVGYNLDELNGTRRNPVPVIVEATGNTTRVVSGSWNRGMKDTTQNATTTHAPMRLLTAKNIERPQIKFRDKIDNSSSPFEPRIKDKPNALKPLAILFEETDTGESFSHPYEYELDLFKPPPNQLKKVEPQKYRNVSDTSLIFVKSPEDVRVLLDDLKKYSEIAVDLEHHAYRSFQGFTCLMQISTRDTDYLIDTLELRDKLHVLNDVFTDSKIVKVFHGATSDIEWLQRDLSLYVVNMFDTHQAARILNFAQLSLAYLLKHYCSVSVNKQFQLADWRIRPLPDELANYAREDTHYLLYVYDVMKNALIDAANGQSSLVLSVIEQSKELCKKKYEKPIYTEDSHLQLYRRNKKMYDNRQMYAFRELYHWRDKTAREEDESTGYILPNHMMMSIAEVLPREVQGILALCSPIPPLVRQNLVKLHQIILKAREQSLTRPIMEDEARMRPIAQAVWNKIDLDSPLYCPHDMKYGQDFREDLPTLLNPMGQPTINDALSHNLQSRIASISLFNSSSDTEEEKEENGSVQVRPGRSLFVSPYERYKCTRPFIEAQERDEQAKEAETERPADVEDTIVTQEIDTTGEEEPVIPFNKQPGKRKRVKEEPDNQNTPQHKTKFPKIDETPSSSTSSEKLHGKRGNVADSDVPGPSKKKKKENKKKQNQVDKVNAANENKSVKGSKPDQFQAFDYNKVDFNKFQGGSKKNTPKQTKNKAGFKHKGKKSKFIGKSNHKSLTFGTKGR